MAPDDYTADALLRRLPVYVLLDTSESMIGPPLDAVNKGLEQLCRDLQSDPVAIETAWISVITFDRHARQLNPLTDVLTFRAPTLSVGPGTSMGEAFDVLVGCLKSEVRTSSPNRKGDYKPLVFLLTDGMPTDDWQKRVEKFKSKMPSVATNTIAVGCGEDVDVDVLRQVTRNVLLMKDLSPGAFSDFFRWVSTSVTTVSSNLGREGEGLNLPAPPGDHIELATKADAAPAAPKRGPAQIILAARCSRGGQGYLMRYRRSVKDDGTYDAERGYPISDGYFADTKAGATGAQIDSSKLCGAPACPHCGNPGWTVTKDREGLVCHPTVAVASKSAQVMFVLDVTGSMDGEIEGVKQNIHDFMDYVRSEGLAVEVGLIAFRDLEMREPPAVLSFGGQVFTGDAKAFKSQVSRLHAQGGGGNVGESSFDAIVLACRQPFRNDVTRILVHITDEPPLLPDGPVRSIKDVTAALKESRIDQLHIVVPRRLTRHYSPLHSAVKGQVFELNAHARGGTEFRKILLDIGRSITVTTRIG